MGWLDDIADQKRAQERDAADAAAQAAGQDASEAARREFHLALLQVLRDLKCEELLLDVRDNVWRCGELSSLTNHQLWYGWRWGPRRSSERWPPAKHQAGSPFLAGLALSAVWPCKYATAQEVYEAEGRNLGTDYFSYSYSAELWQKDAVLRIFAARPQYYSTERSVWTAVTQSPVTVFVHSQLVLELTAGAKPTVEQTEQVRRALVAELARLPEPEIYKIREPEERAAARQLAELVQSGYLKLDSKLIAQYPGLREKVAAELATLPPPSPPAPPPKRARFGRR